VLVYEKISRLKGNEKYCADNTREKYAEKGTKKNGLRKKY
tara:strand:- start:1772 stop:1891 length:120 start_codon:yes stop_codon:yes gene_type:complete